MGGISSVTIPGLIFSLSSRELGGLVVRAVIKNRFQVEAGGRVGTRTRGALKPGSRNRPWESTRIRVHIDVPTQDCSQNLEAG